MKKMQCAICETDDNCIELYKQNFDKGAINEQIFSARRLLYGVHYRVVKCKRCGLVRSDPILSEEELHDLYKKSRFTYQDEVENIKATYGRYLKKALQDTPRRENFLEIGCGNGFFLEVAEALGFKNVYGVEPSKEAVEKSNPSLKINIINKPFQQNLFKENTFDVICLFQVFDHLSEPNQTLQECHRILKDNGIILAINHNVNSFQARFLGEKSPIIDVVHTYLYDKKTTHLIYEKNRFEIIKIFDVENMYSIAYWMSLFPFQQKMKIAILSCLKRLNCDAIRFTCKAGNLGIIARKKE